jgi:hypothetical protein
MTRILVSYVFHIYNELVDYFINNCIFESSNVDFLIICNDKNICFNISQLSNVSVIKRDNVGYDFGGWSDGILTNDLYVDYDYFIFANSSIIGPFLKENFTGRWTDIYINGLYDQNCKLFGSIINTIQMPHIFTHIQSYIFSMDREALEYLIDEEIFTMRKYSKSLIDAVLSKEILMSRKILDKGWNISSLLPLYKGVNFANKTMYNITNDDSTLSYGDLMYEQYRGKLWTEYDLVFIKGNRIRNLFPK